mmetsp:Transcript_10789/g.25901  ORF Transcript_10789/g.25901 Transcript_10789/m.25901 type:complete len:955 (-) Transcript_10789:111-2975(-)
MPAAVTMAHPNNGSHSGDGTSNNMGSPAWTPNQTREYNDLIQEQLGRTSTVGGDGFETASVGSLGSIPLQPGELTQAPHERPGSAPPPPGFVAPDVQDRNRRAEEAIFGTAMKGGATAASNMGDPLNLSHHSAPHIGLGNAGFNNNYDDQSGVTGDSDSTGRGFNMNNLVEALGNDLVGDSTAGTGGGGSLTGGYNADLLLRQKLADNPNYTRQTKHTTLRLIGAQGSSGATGGVAAAPGVSAFGPSYGGEQSRLFGTAGGGGSTASTAAASSAFPSSLSSPSRVQDGGGGGNYGRNNPGPMNAGQIRGSYGQPGMQSGNIGMRVSEPTDGDSQFSGSNFSAGMNQHRMPNNTGGGMYGGFGAPAPQGSMLNSRSKEFRPAASSNPFGGGDNNTEGASIASDYDAGTDASPHQYEADLDPFLWEVGGRPDSSRCIAVLYASSLKPADVRSECEQFGALEAFRAEFSSKGIFFASYYDIRSADLAATELQARLQRIGLLQGSSEDMMVRYCMPLNSSSQHDESQIMINGLADGVGDQALTSMLRSYGAVRACINKGQGSYLIEFQNLQDARQAILELESTQPWGPDVSVDPGTRNSSDRRKGRELLSIIGRWRRSSGGGQRQNNSQPHPNAPDADARYNPGNNNYPGGVPGGVGRGGYMGQQPEMVGFGGAPGGGGGQMDTVTQLIMGPDGRYTPVVVRNPMGGMPAQGGGQFGMGAGQQQIFHGPNGQIFISNVQAPHMQSGGFAPNVVSGQAYVGANRRPGGNAMYYDPSGVVSDNISVHSGPSIGTHGTGYSHHSGSEDKDNRHLLLNLEAVENGRDSRTSLMVRNIPNKYTQQMLLSEFAENGHGPGVIDFFYLPIDFKNRCNRGYAFINFVNCQDILAFHRRYYGKQWRTFNSDKICDITYARIQGKAAMLKRFENSALMDKDDEYKPLVFVSDGPEKGKRLPFAENKPV